MQAAFDSDRVQRVKQIAEKFHAAAQIGDRVMLGYAGDASMPQAYRGSARPVGTITKIKHAGTSDAILKVQLDTGHSTTLTPYTCLDPYRGWEWTDEQWKDVLTRQGGGEDSKYKSSTSAKDVEIASLRGELARMQAEGKNFHRGVVEALAQLTSEVSKTNPDAKFSKVFREEYKSMSKKRAESNPLYNSDLDSDASDVE